METYTIIRPEDRKGWLAQRELGIGSSEVGTILGVNPFETPYQLWLRKKGMTPPVEENEAMRAGHILEGAVARYFEEETGRQVIKSSDGDWLAVDNEKEFLRVSPDRTYWLEGKRRKDNKGILECKTTQMDISADDVPSHWFCQLMYQLGVMRLREGSLAWLTRGRKFGYKTIVFDDEFYRFIVESVERFWVDCIKGNQEPAITTIEDVALKFPKSIGKAVETTDDIMQQVSLLKALKPQLDELGKQKKDAENIIKTFMQDADTLCLPGSKDANPQIICTYKSAKDSQKFNEKLFAKEHPDMYASYMMTVEGSRRFLLK